MRIKKSSCKRSQVDREHGIPTLAPRTVVNFKIWPSFRDLFVAFEEAADGLADKAIEEPIESSFPDFLGLGKLSDSLVSI